MANSNDSKMDLKLMKSKILERFNSDDNKLILLHHNADVDAVASACFLSTYIKNAEIGEYLGISKLGRRFIELLKTPIISNPSLEKFDIVIAVDTSTPAQLGIPTTDVKKFIVIDHHSPSDEWSTDLYLCNDGYSSSVELIYELLEPNHSADKKMDKNLIIALLAGIITDTGRFKYANANTFKMFYQLLNRGGVTISEVLELLESVDFDSFPRKMAHLKGAQRMEYEIEGEHIIAFSEVSAFEASVSNAFILMGADISFVGSSHKDEVRMSARASSELVKRGLHLGKFLKKIAVKFDAEAGGHDGAAGLNGRGNLEEIKKECKHQIKVELRGL